MPQNIAIETGSGQRDVIVTGADGQDLLRMPLDDACRALLAHADLLAACKALLQGAVDYKFEHWAASIQHACESARSAIAKAEKGSTDAPQP